MTDAHRIGVVGTDTLTGRALIILHAAGTPVAGAKLNLLKGGVNYTVTAGKTFTPTAVKLNACAGLINLVYADDAALATNMVTISQFPVITAALHFLFPCTGTAPASKYVGLHNTAAAGAAVTATVIGYES